MIDLGLSKLMLIGVVALVVVGPEKLPRVARTVGTLLGRAQRYVNDIKSEVAQQMNVQELNDMKKSVEEAARNAQASLNKVNSSINKELRDAQNSVSTSLHETQKEVNDVWASGEAKKPYTAKEPVKGKLEGLAPDPNNIQKRLQDLKVPSTPAVEARMPSTTNKAKAAVRRDSPKNASQWRAKRAATPLWYKRRVRSKQVLRSDAARSSEKIN